MVEPPLVTFLDECRSAAPDIPMGEDHHEFDPAWTGFGLTMWAVHG
jgi:hypothetical protein